MLKSEKDNWEKRKRVLKAIRGVNKSSKKLSNARGSREMVQNNPKINLITYPYYEIKRRLQNRLR